MDARNRLDKPECDSGQKCPTCRQDPKENGHLKARVRFLERQLRRVKALTEISTLINVL